MEGADIIHPSLKGSLQADSAQGQVYWDLPGLVISASVMMVIFVCAAVGFLSWKVYVQDRGYHEAYENEMVQELNDIELEDLLVCRNSREPNT
mmetsp:Transcript_25227/g.56890  ORF Transcript_25227/g.56890 Transcript_25227/m.56890 type:complete len:93 (+) Transcript_25227:194-472(+)